MTLEHQSAQSQQSATVVATVVHPFFERRDDRVRRNCREFCEEIAGELHPQKINNHGRQAFTDFQGHIANKTITHNDVSGSFENIIALNVAKKIQITSFGSRPKPFTCYLDDLIALNGFFTDIE